MCITDSLEMENKTGMYLFISLSHLSTQVDYTGVRVIEGQQNSITRVHLLDTYWLIHVFLVRENSTFKVI